MMPDIFIDTIFYIVLTAFVGSGDTLHSNWTIPFENRNECAYFLKNNIKEYPLPFQKDETGNYTISHGETTYYVEFWSHSCQEFYYDQESGKWKQVPYSI